jgi:hypothetical protein
MAKRPESQRAAARRTQQMFDDERADQELRDDLERLCHNVARLDDAGLDVFAKSAIDKARRLSKRLRST